MPVSLSIKNVPDELAQRLRERAKRNHRSVQGNYQNHNDRTNRPNNRAGDRKAFGLTSKSNQADQQADGKEQATK